MTWKRQSIWALATYQRKWLWDGFDTRTFSTCTFIDVMFIHRSQRQEIKAGIFSIIGLFFMFFHISSCLSHYLGSQKILSLRQMIWRMKGIIVYFPYFFHSPFFLPFCLYLQLSSGQMWRMSELQGCTCVCKRDSSNWIDERTGHSL